MTQTPAKSLIKQLEALRPTAIAGGNPEVMLDKCIRIAERYWQAYIESSKPDAAVSLESVIQNKDVEKILTAYNMGEARFKEMVKTLFDAAGFPYVD